MTSAELLSEVDAQVVKEFFGERHGSRTRISYAAR